LVALVITTSAPCSSGRKLIGLAKVASTSSASPNSFATCASGARSRMRITGLVGVSTKMARVVLRTDLRHRRGCPGSTKVTSIPSRTSSSPKSRRVPP
jgi:hypothetical protein